MNNLDEYFNQNKFSLKNKYDEIYDKNINECAYYAIMNNKNNNGGFSYKGNNNKCYLFETQKMNYKLNNDDLNSYNIKSFFKTKSTIDLDKNDDQHDVYNYFNEINNNYYNINGLLDKFNVTNEKECLQKCLTDSSNKCKSVIYLDEPKKCVFYKNKDMKKDDKLFEDNELLYSFKKDIDNKKAIKEIKNNIVYNYKNMSKTENWKKIRDNPILYNCNGMDSTNPFCTSVYNPNNVENNELQYYTDCLDKQFENINEQEKYFTMECKNKYGNEYVFDNNYQNLDIIMKCNDNKVGKIAKCKINMNGDNILNNNIEQNEHFSNGNCTLYNNERISYEEHIDNKNTDKKRFLLLLILFTILIIFLFCKS